MSPSRTRSIGAIVSLACATAALTLSCTSSEYFTGDSLAPRGGKSTAKAGAASQGGNFNSDAGGVPNASAGTTWITNAGGDASVGGQSNGGSTAGGAGTTTGGASTATLGGTSGTSPGDSGGISAGLGGAVGIGGTSPGGATATGGRSAGGATATGGTTTAGRNGTGGSSIGGVATGGVATGGVATGGAATGGAGTGGATIDPDLVLWYKFDDATGTTAADSSGNGHPGTLKNVSTGTASFSTTHQVGTGSVNLVSSSTTIGAYVDVATSLQAMGVSKDVTLSCWANLRTARDWQRIFDFGSSSTGSYMYLATGVNTSSPSAPRFGITTAGNTAEQFIKMTTPATPSTNVWHHFVVVVGAAATYTGTLYIDGVAVGTTTAMTLHPSDLGASTNNWLGRSEFTLDPYFDGMLDDFRIYKRALTAAEVTILYAVR